MSYSVERLSQATYCNRPVLNSVKVENACLWQGQGTADSATRVLHLSWMWFEWTEPERPWVGTDPPATSVDRKLSEPTPFSELVMEGQHHSGNHHG